jgi:hypothetical protein
LALDTDVAHSRALTQISSTLYLFQKVQRNLVVALRIVWIRVFRLGPV